jgi:hypothetical protein
MRKFIKKNELVIRYAVVCIEFLFFWLYYGR